MGTPKAEYKSRLVFEAYDDTEKGKLTYFNRPQEFTALNYTRLRERRRRAIIFLRDVTQAYSQSKEELAPVIYLRPQPQFGFPAHIVFRVERGLWIARIWIPVVQYIPQAPQRQTWYESRNTGPIFLIHTFSGLLGTKRTYRRGANCLQTDGIFNVGTKAFKDKEELAIKAFRHKEAE